MKLTGSCCRHEDANSGLRQPRNVPFLHGEIDFAPLIKSRQRHKMHATQAIAVELCFVESHIGILVSDEKMSE